MKRESPPSSPSPSSLTSSSLTSAQTLAVVVGQTGASLGLGLTGFAIGTWAMSVTGLSSSFTWLLAATTLPGVVLAPIAGVVAERFVPRHVLQAANLLALLSTATLLLCRQAGFAPGLWTAALLTLTGIGFGLHWPAWGKALTMTTTTADERARTAAWLQLGTVAQYVVAPGIAALLLTAIDVEGVLGLDAALLILAMASALVLPLRRTAAHGLGLVAGVLEAWRFLSAHRGLLGLQLFFFVSYIFGGVVVSLSTPLLLSLTDTRTTGICLSISGLGMLVGVAAAVTIGARVRRRVRAVIVLEGVCGLCLLAMGASATVVTVTAVASVFLALTAMSNSLSQGLWQDAVPEHLQVRVFAIRRLLAWGALPVSYAAAGPLADHLATVMAPGPAIDKTAGLAAVFVAAGVGKAVVSLVASRTTLSALDTEW